MLGPFETRSSTCTFAYPAAQSSFMSQRPQSFNYNAARSTTYKRPSHKMVHTDRNYKLATSLAQNRNKRNMKVLERRGATEELERICDLMDRRQQDLAMAQEAKRHTLDQLASADEELEDEDCCAILPVQHAQQIERNRLRELEERQREIDAMEAEIEEYARLAEEEEARIERDAQQAFAMRQQNSVFLAGDSCEPWDTSDEDMEMSG